MTKKYAIELTQLEYDTLLSALGAHKANMNRGGFWALAHIASDIIAKVKSVESVGV